MYLQINKKNCIIMQIPLSLQTDTNKTFDTKNKIKLSLTPAQSSDIR